MLGALGLAAKRRSDGGAVCGALGNASTSESHVPSAFNQVMVVSVMLGIRLAYFKILQPVVGLVAIQMVDAGTRRDRPVGRFPHKPVLEWPSPETRHLHLHVPPMIEPSRTWRLRHEVLIAHRAEMAT
jgi:hypothetical protein